MNPNFGQGRRTQLFINIIILVFFKLRNQLGKLIILILGLFRRGGDNKRRARLINEYRVHLVHNRIAHLVPGPHDHVGDLLHHVVAQIIKAKLIVRAIGYVAPIRLLPARRAQVLILHFETAGFITFSVNLRAFL